MTTDATEVVTKGCLTIQSSSDSCLVLPSTPCLVRVKTRNVDVLKDESISIARDDNCINLTVQYEVFSASGSSCYGRVENLTAHIRLDLKEADNLLFQLQSCLDFHKVRPPYILCTKEGDLK